MIASFLLVGDSQPYVAKMVASAKAVHGCSVVQMSDLRTAAVPGVDEVVRIPFRIPLMPYRMKHLASFDHDEMLVLDTDVICKSAIDDIWLHYFDVGLTLRDRGELYAGDGADIGGGMPFNTGVMFSRSRSFWDECYRWLITQPPDVQRWYGDQRAVAKIAGRGTHQVMILKCAEFNWAPAFEGDSSEARFWHYKGARRKPWLDNSPKPEFISDHHGSH